ncbi:MAG TPA: hypothetical protein VIH06_18460, partial [Ilumatobacteraceae bacterium]
DQPAGSFTSSARHRAATDLAAEWSASVNPYKGLRAFTEADSDEFFGRDDVAVALRDALCVRRFVAIVGPSGSGKSSVVHAGLAPLLRAEGIRIATMVPGDRPGEALREALRSVATTKTSATDESSSIEAAIGDGGGELVVVVDQFEECWTLAGVDDRERFLSALAVAVSHSVRCVVTIRADLYDRPLQHQLVGPLVADGTFALPPLSAEALVEAVVQPARRNGVEFDEGVATAIVAEASAHAAGLPLLQFALAELYERRVDRRITAAALHELGGIGGAVGRRAEQVYQALDQDSQPNARQLFGRLVTPGQGAPDTRRRARLRELSQPTHDVADRFVQARLLVADRDQASREPVLEVAHEALLSNWPRLREWLNSDRNWIAQLQHVATAAGGWSESGLADGELYRGSRLEALVEVLAERGDALNEGERSFVTASLAARDAERERERRTNRRLRRLLTAAVSLLVVALLAGVVAFIQRGRADGSRREAQITTLIDRSLAMRSSNRDAAALLAIESNRLHGDSASMGALFATFTHDPGFLGYLTFDGTRVQGAVVPGTNTAVVSVGGDFGVPDTRLRTVDLSSGDVGPLFDPIGPVDYVYVSATVSADGRVAVAYGTPVNENFSRDPLEMRAFDILTGSAIGPRIVLPELDSNTVTVSGDGSQIAVAAGETGNVRIFDSLTGERIATIPPAADMEQSDFGVGTSSAGWAPDGHLYVGSSGTHLREFDPETFDLLRDIAVPGIATGGALQFSDDGRFLVGEGVVERSGDSPGSMTRVDLKTGVVAWTMGPEEFGFFSCAAFAFSVPQNRLLCADTNGVIRGRSLTTGGLDGTTVEHQRGQLQTIQVYLFGGHEYVASFGRQAASIGRWRVDGTGPIARDTAEGNDIVVYSPDGRRLLLVGPSDDDLTHPKFSIWDDEADGNIRALPADLAGAAWLGDDTIGAVTNAGRASVIDVPSGSSRDLGFDVAANWNTIDALGNGRIAFGYGDGHADVFNFHKGTGPLRIQEVRDGHDVNLPVNQIAASPDGSRIYLSGRGLYVFDGADGRELDVTTTANIERIAVAGNGPIATGNVDGTITLLDPNDLTVVGTLPGARTWLESVDYSADGRFLLAKAADHTMALYDVATRQRMGDAIPIGNANNADLRPDAAEIAVGNPDNRRITLWSLDATTLTRAACAIAGRNLTSSEWHAYVGELADYHPTCPEYAADGLRP